MPRVFIKVTEQLYTFAMQILIVLTSIDACRY